MTKTELQQALGSEWQTEEVHKESNIINTNINTNINININIDIKNININNLNINTYNFPFQAPYICLYYSSLDSTQDEAERLPQSVFKDRQAVLLVAQRQLAGHGRLGRAWHAPENAALAFTIMLPITTSRPMGHWPLLAGWIQLRAYASWISFAKLDLKWPNDVLIEGKKVSGVLCGMRRIRGQDWLCMGIGVNVGDMQFPEELQATATSLSHHTSGNELDSCQVLAVLIECLLQDIQELTTEDLLKQFQSKSSICKGVEIRYTEQEQVHTGVTAGLDASGALRCQTKDGLKALLVSEVFQVRPL
jgi:BirA family transcriptional regulator, biotin operon repressor / biotin---[acetyl-CoA-carboxylase] ligase